MTLAAAQIIWIVIGGYAATGAFVAVLLLCGPIARIDPLAFAAPLRVKLLLAPGLAALWPLTLTMALRGKQAAET